MKKHIKLALLTLTCVGVAWWVMPAPEPITAAPASRSRSTSPVPRNATPSVSASTLPSEAAPGAARPQQLRQATAKDLRGLKPHSTLVTNREDLEEMEFPATSGGLRVAMIRQRAELEDCLVDVPRPEPGAGKLRVLMTLDTNGDIQKVEISSPGGEPFPAAGECFADTLDAVQFGQPGSEVVLEQYY